MKRLKRTKRRTSRKAEIIIILTIMTVIAGFFIMRGSRFDVMKITVRGTVRLSEAEVISASGLTEGENIFSVNASKVEKRIEKLFLVENASIVKHYPDSIEIVVTEKTPFLTVVIDGRYYAMDKNGTVIHSSEALESDYGILLTGVDELDLSVGSTYSFIQNARTAVAYEVVQKLMGQGYTRFISEIHCSEKGYYYLYTKKSNVIKFYSLSGFTTNLDFIELFLENEDRHIMVEVVEGSEPVYKVIDIN